MKNLILAMLCLFCARSAQAIDGRAQRVDTRTLSGKVMVGYQGWFNCKGDSMDRGWTHWARHQGAASFGPGNVTVDLWPDMSEYDRDERFATDFRHQDGSTAEVFSSANRKTVLRHFRWMQEYGIDGAFVQRFASGIGNRSILRHRNAVLSHARDGAEEHGRAFAVMYDLSSMKTGSLEKICDDWRMLQSKIKVGESSSYLNHNGKPLVAIWGVGFKDRHQDNNYTLEDCRKLIAYFKDVGCSIMVGVPTGWRDLDRDAVGDPQFHQILKMVDVISPWTPGRYRTPEQAHQHAVNAWQPDRQWCDSESIDYLPVVFPGFSWHNLKGAPLGDIPRLKGQFLWSQIAAAKRAGADMLYVAMFDEVDEGTAIFKCTNDVPVGEGVSFLTYEGLPSDYYLQLVGHGAKVLRGEAPATNDLPKLSQP